MPKKTKKQKLKSHQNRQKNEAAPVETKTAPVETKEVESPFPTFSFKKTSSSPVKTHYSAADHDAFMYLRGDLLRTVVLAIVCCGVLVGLSFVLK